MEPQFKNRCEAIAVEQRRQLELRAYDPLPAERLLEHLNGIALLPNQFSKLPPASVAVLMKNNDWSAGIIMRHPLVIVYNPAHPPARHQSNLMHEFAHVLLDHPLIDFNPVTGLPRRKAQYEDEANYLGGCLQIPRLGLQATVQRGYTQEQIAEHFGASVAMVRFRCNMTGIKVNF